LQALQDACADGGEMKMMRHCRQCRADAVGMLGEDRGAEFTLEKIEMMEIDYEAAMQRRAAVHAEIEAKRQAQRTAPAQAQDQAFVSIASITRRRAEAPSHPAHQPLRVAVASTGGGVINQHFGHAREFLVYEADGREVRFVGTRRVDAYCSGGDTCGEAETALAGTIRALEGCEAVLCSKIGIEPWDALEAAGIAPNGEHAMEPIEDAVAAVCAELTANGRPGEHIADTALSA